MTALIICNGSIGVYSYYNKFFADKPFIICVDGGASHARQLDVTPDILVGDFDSISGDDYSYFSSMGIEILRFPVEKNMTDTEIAVDYAINRGFRFITIIGGLGTRFDHSLSNVLILKKMLDNGVQGRIVNEYNEITLINDRIVIDKERGLKVTLLPFCERVEGVSTKGMYYPLDNATIEIGSTLGVSNEFASETAEVSVKSGLLLVIKSRD